MSRFNVIYCGLYAVTPLQRGPQIFIELLYLQLVQSVMHSYSFFVAVTLLAKENRILLEFLGKRNEMLQINIVIKNFYYRYWFVIDCRKYLR